MSIVPNGCMDQDVTWYGGWPRPNHIVLDGDPAPVPKKGQSPQFSVHVHCGCMNQDATWYGGRPWPRPHGARWGPISPPPKRGTAPNFRPMSRGRPEPRPHCARWGTSFPSPKRGHNSPFWRMFVVSKRLDGSRCHFVRR